jgi:hypothetical protein
MMKANITGRNEVVQLISETRPDAAAGNCRPNGIVS